jgi:hypothetical protein
LGRKCGAVADANSAWGCSVTKSTFAGSGKSGATEGVEVPVKLINAQIGQSKSANPFRTGSRELGPSDAAAADDNAVSTEIGTREWTWPKVSANCSASATSARREPKCIFDRNQRIVRSVFVHARPARPRGRPLLSV